MIFKIITMHIDIFKIYVNSCIVRYNKITQYKVIRYTYEQIHVGRNLFT